MNNAHQATEYAPLPNSLSEILKLFKSLPSPETVPSEGRFYGQSIGPAWLIAMGWPLLNFGPLAGWKGKQFYPNGHVMNIVERKGKESEIVHITGTIAAFSRGEGNTIELDYPQRYPTTLEFCNR